uniref:Uncharacterized protein n=1 Tax=Molossus molossus TaxID=27622 RepID=A0A7J8GKZ9_MOLMO|nr:hypothetical protein HJG59_011451 [Molossus molossus]
MPGRMCHSLEISGKTSSRKVWSWPGHCLPQHPRPLDHLCRLSEGSRLFWRRKSLPENWSKNREEPTCYPSCEKNPVLVGECGEQHQLVKDFETEGTAIIERTKL